MKHSIDCRGLACPQPVINARSALEKHPRITVIVDNETALGNIQRMAESMGCAMSMEKKNDGIYIELVASGASAAPGTGPAASTVTSHRSTGPRVLAVSRDAMGSGDDALGRILIRSFFHTIAEAPPAPDVIIFFNSGVKLAVDGSDALEDLKTLEARGVRILSCGTCLDYFKVKDRLRAGSVSNMYEIKELMFSASSTINL